MTAASFHASEQLIKAKKRQQYVGIGIFCFGMFALILTPMALYGWWFVLGVLGFSVFMGAILIIGSSNSLEKQFGSLSIELNDEGIKYSDKTQTEAIDYTDISKIKIKQTRSGNIYQIEVFSANNYILIHGVSHLDKLLSLLLGQIPQAITVSRKRVYFEPGKVSTVILGGIAGMSVVIFFFQYFGIHSHIFLSGMYFFGVGIYLLLYKSISKTYMRSQRRTQIGIGIVYSLLGLANLGMFFFVGTNPILSWQHPCGWIGKYVENSGCVRTFDQGEYVAFLPDNETLAFDYHKGIPLSPFNGWQGIWTPILRHDDRVENLMLSRNGQILVSQTSNREKGHYAWVWDIGTQTLIAKLPWPDNSYFGELATVSSDGQLLIAYNDDVIDIWQIRPWARRLSFSGRGPTTFSPNDNYIAAINDDRQVAIWDVHTGNEILEMEKPEHYSNNLLDLEYSPNGTRLAAIGYSSEIFVWDTTTGELLYVFQDDFGSSAKSIAFSPDGMWLVGGYNTRENYLTIWNLQTGEQEREILLGKGHYYYPKSFAFTPDGQKLAVGTNDGALVFDFEDMLK